MTTRKDNIIFQTINIIYNKNSISIINKITKSNSRHINSKQNNPIITSVEKIKLVLNLTG